MRTIIVATVLLTSASAVTAQSSLHPVELIYLEHLQAGPTVDIVARMLSSDGICAPHVETNSLVIVDDPARVRRIRDLVQRLEARAAQRAAQRPRARPRAR